MLFRHSMALQIYDNIIFNGIRKIYPDGSCRVMISDRAIFREPGWESIADDARGRADGFRTASLGATCAENETAQADADAEELKKLSSRRKARTRLRDICRSTSFKWFVTLTLDASRIDRYDMDAVIRRMNVWLDNRVRRNGLAYVLVPEHHKDGAIHFHGFFNDALDGTMVPSGVVQDGREVFNCSAWSFGFSNVMELVGDYASAVGYVCKYIGKESEKVGGRWYYSGGALGRPRLERFTCEYSPDTEGYHMTISALGARCVIMDFDPAGVQTNI